jgi:hypothetical protein
VVFVKEDQFKIQNLEKKTREKLEREKMNLEEER